MNKKEFFLVPKSTPKVSTNKDYNLEPKYFLTCIFLPQFCQLYKERYVKAFQMQLPPNLTKQQCIFKGNQVPTGIFSKPILNFSFISEALHLMFF